jgi:hypothetical protein
MRRRGFFSLFSLKQAQSLLLLLVRISCEPSFPSATDGCATTYREPLLFLRDLSPLLAMCPHGITASVPITWQQAKAWIEEGTVESLGRLRRSEAQLSAYRTAMDKVRTVGGWRRSLGVGNGRSPPSPDPKHKQVKQQYASVSDYVKASVLGAPTAPNAEGKLEATTAEPPASANCNGNGHAERRRLIWRLNDFPYYYEDGIEHHLMWCTEPLEVEEIERLARERFAPGGAGNATGKKRQHLIFVNPAPLQSVLAVWHAHVLVRDEPQEGDEEA